MLNKNEFLLLEGWGGMGQGGCELRNEAFLNIQKKKKNGGGGGGGGWGVELGGGGQGGCEWRSEAFVKIQKKKKIFFFFLGGGGGQVGGVRVDGN